MNHVHPDGNLSDYLDRQLEPQSMGEWRLHLQTCRECALELAELTTITDAARRWVPGETAHNSWETLARHLNEARADTPRRRWQPLLPAAAVLVVALYGVTAGWLRTSEDAWPEEVAVAVAAVERLERTARPMLTDLNPELREKLTQLLEDVDSALAGIQASRSLSVDPALIADVHVGALKSKLMLLQGIRDLHSTAVSRY